MTCREVLDFLLDYLDGNLSSAQRAVFEEHLAVCTACVAYLHNYQQAVKLGKATAAQDNGGDIPEDLVQAILLARKEIR
jgi:anti-sigma factor RsiW